MSEAATLFSRASEGPWLFGRTQDLLAFGGSAAASLLLVAIGHWAGWLSRTPPEWLFVGAILLVDVAHVWSTVFRVYLDKDELTRRPVLYWGAPIACYGVLFISYQISSPGFWTVLAYAAVFHFVRQQAGWLRLYQRRAKEQDPFDKTLDRLAIYAATVFPLIYWHANLPLEFIWFIEGDFVSLSSMPVVADALVLLLQPAYWAVLLLFVVRQAFLGWKGRPINWGKVLLVMTTWLCWWLGIVALNSDFAFTVTNVLIHGIPYFFLTYRYARMRSENGHSMRLRRALTLGVPGFLLLTSSLAFLEEGLWDRVLWHEREWLFGDGWEASAVLLGFLVPLLATPQATHYLLDGFIWRGQQNPVLRSKKALP